MREVSIIAIDLQNVFEVHCASKDGSTSFLGSCYCRSLSVSPSVSIEPEDLSNLFSW